MHLDGASNNFEFKLYALSTSIDASATEVCLHVVLPSHKFHYCRALSRVKADISFLLAFAKLSEVVMGITDKTIKGAKP